MTATTTTTDALRCAELARVQDADPIGTAGTYAGFALVEWPLPWPRAFGDIPELDPVKDALRHTGFRLQGLVPTAVDRRRVVLYRRPDDGPFVAYHHSEREVMLQGVLGDDGVKDPTVVGRALGAALAELIASSRSGEPGPEQAAPADVLICTHGRRDRCCGARGTELWKDVSEPGALGPAARVWRTSHTGGHRYAATAIVLPQGTAWAFLDRPTLARIVAQEGPLADLLPHYRGGAGLRKRSVQVLERAVLGEVGWPLLSSGRHGEVLDDGRVRLTVTPALASPSVSSPSVSSPSVSSPSVWEGTVVAGRELPVPDCGAPIEGAHKSQTELNLTGFARVG